MKNREVMRALAAVSLAVAGLTAVSLRGGYVSGQHGASNDHDVVRDALRRGGLREAARVKGHYVGEFDPHWDFGRFDIEALAKNSAAVILGVPVRKVGSRLTPSGQAIVTDFEVRVDRVFKGAAEARSSITVSLPGGLVRFEDGSTAELMTPEFDPLKLGATYTMFLSESEGSPGVYTLSGGPQGLVEIVNDTTLKSHGRPTDPVSEESRGKNRDTFLDEVRGKSEKWPLPGRCCS